MLLMEKGVRPIVKMESQGKERKAEFEEVYFLVFC